MDFNESALGVAAYNDQKNRLAEEISSIIGFDVFLLRHVKEISRAKELGYVSDFVENGYEQASGLDQPISFGYHWNYNSIFSFIPALVGNSYARFAVFKKDDEWHITEKANVFYQLDYDAARPISTEEIKQKFCRALYENNISIEELLQAKERSKEGTALAPKPQ